MELLTISHYEYEKDGFPKLVPVFECDSSGSEKDTLSIQSTDGEGEPGALTLYGTQAIGVGSSNLELSDIKFTCDCSQKQLTSDEYSNGSGAITFGDSTQTSSFSLNKTQFIGLGATTTPTGSEKYGATFPIIFSFSPLVFNMQQASMTLREPFLENSEDVQPFSTSQGITGLVDSSYITIDYPAPKEVPEKVIDNDGLSAMVFVNTNSSPSVLNFKNSTLDIDSPFSFSIVNQKVLFDNSSYIQEVSQETNCPKVGMNLLNGTFQAINSYLDCNTITIGGSSQMSSELFALNSSLHCVSKLYREETDTFIPPFYSHPQSSPCSVFVINSVIEGVSPNEETPVYSPNLTTSISSSYEYSGYFEDYTNPDSPVIWKDAHISSDDFKVYVPCTIPLDLTIKENQAFGPNSSSGKVALAPGVTLTNYGTLYNPQYIECSPYNQSNAESAQILTLLSFDTDGGSSQPESKLLLYKDTNGVKTYGELPSVTKDGKRALWYSDPDHYRLVTADSPIDVNVHTLYASYDSSAPGPSGIGWQHDDYGWKYMYDEDGHFYTSGWQWINNAWFYFNDEAYALENMWSFIEGVWYYFGPGCYLRYGWLWIDEHWYFLNRSTGAMETGWVWDGVWYYCDQNNGGAMKDNCWGFIEGLWYGFNAGGAMTEGWTWSYAYNGWFYCEPAKGKMLTGWNYIAGHWYYLSNNGRMAANTFIDGHWLSSNGIRR